MDKYYLAQYDTPAGPITGSHLYHAPAGVPVPKHWSPISRKLAVELARAERRRRKAEPGTPSTHDAEIWPHDVGDLPRDIYDHRFYSDGVIMHWA